MNNTRQTNDAEFLDAVAADLETLIHQGAAIEECVILVDSTGAFQVLHLPMITVAPEVVRLAKVPMIVLRHKFLEGHSGIISLSLSSI